MKAAVALCPTGGKSANGPNQLFLSVWCMPCLETILHLQRHRFDEPLCACETLCRFQLRLWGHDSWSFLGVTFLANAPGYVCIFSGGGKSRLPRFWSQHTDCVPCACTPEKKPKQIQKKGFVIRVSNLNLAGIEFPRSGIHLAFRGTSLPPRDTIVETNTCFGECRWLWPLPGCCEPRTKHRAACAGGFILIESHRIFATGHIM